MAKKKAVDPIKQREKRAKVMLAVCGVALLGALVFEGPTFMKLFSPPKPPVEATSTTPAGTVTPGALTPPALPGSAPTPAPGAAAPGDLIDTDVPVSSAPAGQLVSFGLFETKNPFKPQVTSSPADAGTVSVVPPPATGPAPGSTGGGSSAGSGAGTSKNGADVPPAATPDAPAATPTPNPTPAPTAVPPAATGPAPGATPATPAAPASAAVTISVNGRSERVAKDGTFPASAPVFRLVSFLHGSAQIAIVGGSYQTGDPTLTLQQGKQVTLQNTSTNTRYTLLLVSTP